jgi:hypothetical protein
MYSGWRRHVIELQLPRDAPLSAHAVERKLTLESSADVEISLLWDSSS